MYQPINLVSGMSKIMLKVLANRMSLMVEKLISKPPHVIVKGRQILDYVLTVKECLDNKLKLRKSKLLCKLDTEKAYDCVNWRFLLYILKQCDFCSKWCYWINHCISTTCLSILVQHTRRFLKKLPGLRQGDLVSPLLYVFVMEAFSRMITGFVVGRFLCGFLAGKESISHLLYADDTNIL